MISKGVTELPVGAEVVVLVEVELDDVVEAAVEVELGDVVVEAAVEAGLPLLFAFAPQARVTAVRQIRATVLNNIFFIGVL